MKIKGFRLTFDKEKFLWRIRYVTNKKIIEKTAKSLFEAFKLLPALIDMQTIDCTIIVQFIEDRKNKGGENE